MATIGRLTDASRSASIASRTARASNQPCSRPTTLSVARGKRLCGSGTMAMKRALVSPSGASALRIGPSLPVAERSFDVNASNQICPRDALIKLLLAKASVIQRDRLPTDPRAQAVQAVHRLVLSDDSPARRF